MAAILEVLRPDEHVGCVAEVDVAILKQDGFDTLLLDLDNTLLPWSSSQLPEPSRKWIEGAKRLGMKICIVSNTHNPARLRAIADQLGIESIHRALKPFRTGFAKALRILGSVPGAAVVIGDQLLTDIAGGNRAGMRTILVEPMDSREFVGTKISRLVERLVFALLGGARKTGTISRRTQSEEQDTK